MENNIPIYRAKSNERKNTYVEGFLIGTDEETGLCAIKTKDDCIGGEICFLDTLSIHFPDMVDSDGNKIFSSLSKNGKGGDIVELQASSGTCLSCGEKLSKTLSVAIYEQMEFKEIELNPHECFEKRESNYLLIGNIKYKKVVGIKE